MNAKAVRTLQRILTEDGRYAGPMNGTRDTATTAAVNAMIAARSAELSTDPRTWSARRRAIACLQLGCKDRNISAGPADGLWGTRTDSGYEELVVLFETGSRPVPWRDRAPSTANPNSWPTQNEDDIRAFFGPPSDAGLVLVRCPWQLALAWNTRTKTRNIRCHPRVADSLARVLDRVHTTYGEARIQELRLHLYGGCYNNRAMRGGTRLSTHAWGIAIDWDPAHNKLRWGRDRATLSADAYEPWWQAWEDEGWVSLGRERNFDWMHVQAVRLG